MVSHVVLFRLRPDFTDADRTTFVAAFEVAVRNIPTVRGVRIGRRVTFGAGYEQGVPGLEFSAIIDFDNLAGLKTYLAHPAHQDLGARFNASIAQGLVYDYELMGADETRSTPCS